MSMEVRDQFDTEWVDFRVANSFELISTIVYLRMGLF